MTSTNKLGECAVCRSTFDLRYAVQLDLMCSRPRPCEAVICPKCVVGMSDNHRWKCLYCPDGTDGRSEAFACEMAGSALQARKDQVRNKKRARQVAKRLEDRRA